MFSVVLVVAGCLLIIAALVTVFYVASYNAHSQSFNLHRRAAEIQKQMRMRGEGMEGFTQL